MPVYSSTHTHSAHGHACHIATKQIDGSGHGRWRGLKTIEASQKVSRAHALGSSSSSGLQRSAQEVVRCGGSSRIRGGPWRCVRLLAAVADAAGRGAHPACQRRAPTARRSGSRSCGWRRWRRSEALIHLLTFLCCLQFLHVDDRLRDLGFEMRLLRDLSVRFLHLLLDPGRFLDEPLLFLLGGTKGLGGRLELTAKAIHPSLELLILPFEVGLDLLQRGHLALRSGHASLELGLCVRHVL